MHILTFKIVAVFIIFITGLLGGALSKWLSGSRKSDLLFSFGNAFAGGVFLGAGLIHMLPDAQAGFKSLTGSDYPWFTIVCCAGFLLILFIEKVLIRHEHAPQDASSLTGKLILYPYILMIVLSIHSVITGIALGTEARIAQASIILIAVMAHKGTAAFALTVSLLRGAMPLKRIVGMVVLFSLMTPVGILLGIGFMMIFSGRAEQIFEAGFDALAAGSFLYIAMLDILQEEFSVQQHRPLKFVLVLAGLAVMAVVAIWT
ncbi:MAG: ZIP family metal transporter [Verrucomicrobia bacterium]|nr:ZIP family metal transporter [Verrucomicrobiota bacterium]MBU1735815.1 ZIP family metal transporter [Verrucomicrobiota bacterium]MBU1858092.1 ZIP family metal transporter [Verrucomicrobiota bacterium]